MKTNHFVVLLITAFSFCLTLFTSCKKNKNDDLNNLDCSKINATYASDVRPVLEANCLSSGCHNSNSTNGDFTSYTGVKVKVDNSSFDSRVIQQKNMPLSSSLTTEQLKKIKCWLNAGALNN